MRDNDNHLDLPPYQSPDEAIVGTRDYDIIQWCEERRRRGEAFLKAQPGYQKIDENIRAIFGQEMRSDASYIPGPSTTLSKTEVNLMAKASEDLSAQLTDTRYFWNYTTKNPKYEKQFKYSNMKAEKWYGNRQIAMRIGDAITYYTVAGTGFIHLYYSRRLDDMMVESLDPRMVFPVDPLSYHTLQDAQGTIIRRPKTPEYFREEYDKEVKPESGGGGAFGWLTRLISGPAEGSGPLTKKSGADQEIPHMPTAYENILYLNDTRMNRKSDKVRMGPWSGDVPQTPWSYEVAPGAPLYPFKRMIVWANGVLCYDGPSPYWHGQTPVIKLTLSPYQWSWFGKAPLTDCMPLNKSINANLRVIDNHNAQIAQPGMIADRNVSKSEMNKFDSSKPGYKIKTNMASGKGISVVDPPHLEDIIKWTIGWCEDKLQKLSGTADASQMANLGQIPSDDTIDTIMKAMTPGVRKRSRILEAFYTELSEQYLFCIWEWDSLARRVAEFGPQAATKEDFDYDPRVGIPDDVPDGEPGDIAGTKDALGMDNPRPLWMRCKAMLLGAVCKFDPSSLLNSAAQQELMQYFLLAKMGYVSVFTLWEKMGKMNFAPASMVIPTDEIGRLQLQQSLGIGMIANAQGRKASDSAPPAMGQNAAGPTIVTS